MLVCKCQALNGDQFFAIHLMSYELTACLSKTTTKAPQSSWLQLSSYHQIQILAQYVRRGLNCSLYPVHRD